MSTDSELHIASLPKVELHLHLDCSMSYSVVSELLPGISESEYRERFIPPAKCRNLAQFLACATHSVALLQTETALRAAARDLFDQLERDHVIYAEVRYAPLLHTENGMSPESIVEIVNDAFTENAERTGISGGLILCTLRHFDELQSLQTAKLVEKYLDRSPVAGFDIASDEAAFSIDAHRKAFAYAIASGIPRTAHAGEARGPESVWETLKYFQPSRLGHGVRSIEDPALVDHLAENGIHLEVCPTCNIQIDIFDAYPDHPVDQLVRAGVPVGVNTDARTLVNITLDQEYKKLSDTFGWKKEDFYRVNRNALNAAFTSDSNRQHLLQKLSAGFNK